MGFLNSLFGGIPKNGIITARFRIDDDYNINLSLEQGGNVSSVEYIHFFLGYYLRTLINLKHSPNAFNVLKHSFNNLFSDLISRKTDVLKIIEIDDAISIVPYTPKNYREYIATSTALDQYRRSIFIKLPDRGYEQDMVFSVYVLLSHLLKILDDKSIVHLSFSAKKLSVGDGLKSIGVDMFSATGSRDAVGAAIIASQEDVSKHYLNIDHQRNVLLSQSTNNINKNSGDSLQESAFTNTNFSHIPKPKTSNCIYDGHERDRVAYGEFFDYVALVAQRVKDLPLSKINVTNLNLGSYGYDDEMNQFLGLLCKHIHLYAQSDGARHESMRFLDANVFNEMGEDLVDLVIKIALSSYDAFNLYNIKILYWVQK